VASPTSDDLLGALRAWLLTQVPAGVEVVQAFDSGVPEPRVQDPADPGGTVPVGFVTIQTVHEARLSTTGSSYEDGGHNGVDTFQDLSESAEWVAQVDVYGPLAEDWARGMELQFASMPAVDFFGQQLAGLAPLFAEDRRQAPIVDGEKQYERRIVLVLHLNYTVAAQVPQDFAAALTPTVINVAATYNP